MPSRTNGDTKQQAGPAGAHVALLRGINVGGKNKVPMADLAALFTKAGCAAVRTYIQSGNVVFTVPEAQASALPALLTKRIEERFGLRVPVIVRSAAELAQVTRDNPFLAAGEDADTLHVMFLTDVPVATAIARLDPDRSPPDRFTVVGREVYLACPGGLGRTKLTNDYFDRTLGTVSTVRNWRTVTKLLEMAQS